LQPIIECTDAKNLSERISTHPFLIVKKLQPGEIYLRFNGGPHRRDCGVAAGHCFWNLLRRYPGKRYRNGHHCGVYYLVPGRKPCTDRWPDRCVHRYCLRDSGTVWGDRTGDCHCSCGGHACFDGCAQARDSHQVHSLPHCCRVHKRDRPYHFLHADKRSVWIEHRQSPLRFLCQMGGLFSTPGNHQLVGDRHWRVECGHHLSHSKNFQENTRIADCDCFNDRYRARDEDSPRQILSGSISKASACCSPPHLPLPCWAPSNPCCPQPLPMV